MFNITLFTVEYFCGIKTSSDYSVITLVLVTTTEILP